MQSFFLGGGGGERPFSAKESSFVPPPPKSGRPLSFTTALCRNATKMSFAYFRKRKTLQVLLNYSSPVVLLLSCNLNMASIFCYKWLIFLSLVFVIHGGPAHVLL